MSPAPIDFSAINTAAVGFLHSLLPGGNVVGREYVLKNPTRPTTRPAVSK
jgi:hypothetical protein